MKHIFTAALAITALCSCTPAPNHWEDPHTVAINKKPARASFHSYTSKESALAGDYENSSRHISLNGQWQFHWSRNPSERP
ncbi:MAG: hypothetical protein OIF34_13420, partial [Porticoccaceae bacterium]|nr:hypothetical protein [Porticoccaceae bacterium]